MKAGIRTMSDPQMPGRFPEPCLAMHIRRAPALAAALTLFTLPVTDAAQAGTFDELRFGVNRSVERFDNEENGVFLTGVALFDPLGHGNASGLERLLVPRLHVGADISTAGETNQFYAGFSWTADLTDIVFVEAGLGGTLHDGKLDEDGTPGPKLGSRVLFHEYAAIGVNLDRNWRILGQIEHSSNANFADPNDGLSRAGVLIGYKF